jgi:hypothetical protein
VADSDNKGSNKGERIREWMGDEGRGEGQDGKEGEAKEGEGRERGEPLALALTHDATDTPKEPPSASILTIPGCVYLMTCWV